MEIDAGFSGWDFRNGGRGGKIHFGNYCWFWGFSSNLGVFSWDTKWLKEMVPCNSMTQSQYMIRELLYGIDDETLQALLEYKKQLWQARLEQDIVYFEAQNNDNLARTEPPKVIYEFIDDEPNEAPTDENIVRMEPLETICEFIDDPLDVACYDTFRVHPVFKMYEADGWGTIRKVSNWDCATADDDEPDNEPVY